MSRDVIITPASGLVDFQNFGVSRAQVVLGADNNLTIGNSGGTLSIGNTAANVYIGDGANSVDVIFEQNGKIRALSNKTLTLGQSDSFVTTASPLGFLSPNGSFTITARMLNTDVLSFQGNAGELLALSDTMTGTIFSVNDVSGIPSIEVLDTGTIRLAQYGGSVGIGLANPAARLHVQNSTNAILNQPAETWAVKVLQAFDSSGNNGLLVGNRWAADTSTVFEAGSLFGTGSAWGSYYRITGLGTHIWGGGASASYGERMRVTSGGNVGIGTNNPTDRLQVNGTASATTLKTQDLTGAKTRQGVYDASNNLIATPVGIEYTNAFIHFTGGSSIAPNAMYRSGGDWPVPYGIGWGTGGESSGIFQRFSASGGSIGELTFYVGNDGQGSFAWRRQSWESTTFQPGGSQNLATRLAYLDWGGNFTGDTSVRSPLFYLSNDTISRWGPNAFILRGGSPTAYFRDTDHFSAMIHCNANQLYFLRGAVDTESWAQVNSQWPLVLDLSNNNATFGAGIFAVGDVTAYSSDRRLKENIRPIENSLEKVLKLNGVTFDWKDEVDQLGFVPSRKYNDAGLIAQEVQEVLPQAVAPAPFDVELDAINGTTKSKSGENYITVKYEKLVPLLIEAIKEQNSKIERLEKLVEQLLHDK